MLRGATQFRREFIPPFHPPYGGAPCDFGLGLIRPLQKCPSRNFLHGLSAYDPLSFAEKASILLFHLCVIAIVVQNLWFVNFF